MEMFNDVSNPTGECEERLYLMEICSNPHFSATGSCRVHVRQRTALEMPSLFNSFYIVSSLVTVTQSLQFLS